MKFKRFVTAILSLVMVAALSVPAFAYELKSFSDVAEDHWAYKAIMRSVELGLIAGTKAPDANGVGEFNPNANMTRAQFIVVTMRAVAPDVLNELNNAGQGETWYSNATQLAVQLGILEWTDFGGLSETANMNKAITREEMAHILSNATSVLGQTPSSKISTSRITDWSKVSSEYQLDVINAYSLGMLTGYANPGNFGPKDNMSRAQACAVLNRLLDVDSRANVDTSTPTQKPSESNNQSSYIGATIKGQTTEAQTWKEGEKPYLTGMLKGWGLVRGSENPVAAGLFLRYYLDVGNYNTSSAFISDEAESFFFNFTKTDSDRYAGYTPYYTNGLPGTMNETITGGAFKKWDVYNISFGDPSQVASSLSALSSAVDKAADNFNKHVAKNTGLK